MKLTNYNYNRKELKSLKSLDLNTVYPVSGYKYATSKYGEFVILNSEEFDIALPGRMVKMFKKIEQDPEAVNEIASGRYGIKVVEFNYNNQFGSGITRGIEFTKMQFY